MTKRIFRSILAVTITVLLASLVLIVGVLHGYFEDRVLAELESRTAYIAHGVEQSGLHYLSETLPADCRVTWVAADGTVLFDNWDTALQMENHAQRQEIQDALRLGRGRSARYSETMSKRTLYDALRLRDGTVLRVSDTQYSAWMLVIQVMQPVALLMLLAVALAMALASRVSRQLVRPINAIDPADPAGEADTYEELAPLLRKIRSQNRQIQRQMLDLRRRQEEFAAITAHMSEGLLVLDKGGRVLSHNAAALDLLRAAPQPEGATVYAFCREAGFRRGVEEALAGRHCEERLTRPGSCCQLIASPVERDGALAGAVLVLLDVTEKEQRETLRREFTANVSHELKTPLTAMLGTAEILQQGLVKPQDVSHFAGNIHRETQRLIGLVSDIIKLSRLDEGGPADQWERVELYALAGEVLERLETTASRREVTLTLTGGKAAVMGVPRMVEELIHNLCDNAVAYNRPGGTVTVTVEQTPQGPRLTVADTGIGIPPEDRERVFERFYRVEKSHSGGGTGLGLSIVKHAAAYLGAKITLDSTPGKGTTFTLTFPPAEGA